jgi:glycerol uptake facilitator-like aquaporin
MVKMAFGNSTEASSPDALKGALAEFISLFLFVFIGVGSVMSYEKIHPAGDLEAGGLLIIATAHGLALAVLVAMTANLSGGHVNPAVSLGLALAGKITIIRLFLYWIAQLLGSVAGNAIAFLPKPHNLPMPAQYLADTQPILVRYSCHNRVILRRVSSAVDTIATLYTSRLLVPSLLLVILTFRVIPGWYPDDTHVIPG